MKNLIIIIIFLIFNFSYSQNIGIEKRYIQVLNVNSNSLIFNKENGKLISYEKFNNMIKQDPSLIIEVKDEDVNGKPISFFLQKKNLNNESTNRISIKRKDINNNIFQLENSEGKNTLIILQLEFHFPAINVESLKIAENFALKNNRLNSIIITSTNKNIAKEFASEQGFKSIIIPNAMNLIHKFGFKRSPVFVIVDSSGKILETTYYSDELESVFN